MIFCKIKKAFFGVAACLMFGLLVCPSVSAVTVEDLAGNTLDAYGAEKTLPFTTWGDVPFDELKSMTLHLSEQKKSAVLADLTAEVLMQRTFMTPSSRTAKQSEEWLTVRLQSLVNLGYEQKVLQMIDNLPAEVQTISILKIKLDALFLADNWEDACRLAARNASKDAAFEQAQLFCLGLLGQRDKALMAFDMWRESKGADNITAFVMGALMDMPVAAPTEAKTLTVPETFVLLQLKSPYLENATLPVPYQRITAQKYTSFGNAVNVEKLLDVWEKAGLSAEQKAYRLYLLSTYANLFLPDLRLIRQKQLWQMPATELSFSPRALFFKDKPEIQITGADLITGLWLLSTQSMGIENVLLVLQKGGLDLEPFILEQMNP